MIVKLRINDGISCDARYNQLNESRIWRSICRTSPNTGVNLMNVENLVAPLRVLRTLVFVIAVVSTSFPAVAQLDGGGALPRVGEIPPGCNTNGLEVSTSVLGGACFGGPLQYFIIVSNPTSVFPAVTCQASQITVRFWAPDNLNVHPGDICHSSGETINLTPQPITLAPGSSVSFVGGNGPGQIPQLLFSPTGPGSVTAYVCVQGVSNQSANGTPFVTETGIDTIIAPTPTCTAPPALVCAGEQVCASASGGTGLLTVAWSGPDGFVASSTCIVPTIPGTYTAIVTDENGCVSSGCESTVQECQPPAPNPTPCTFCIINDPEFQRQLLLPLVPQSICGVGAGTAFAGVYLALLGARRRRR